MKKTQHKKFANLGQEVVKNGPVATQRRQTSGRCGSQKTSDIIERSLVILGPNSYVNSPYNQGKIQKMTFTNFKMPNEIANDNRRKSIEVLSKQFAKTRVNTNSNISTESNKRITDRHRNAAERHGASQTFKKNGRVPRKLLTNENTTPTNVSFAFETFRDFETPSST
jgi:hypothetical protein